MGSDGKEGLPVRGEAHAAAGRTRLKKAFVQKPDTIVKLPSGEEMVLRRREEDSMPVFRKFNPKRYDQQTGKPHGKGAKGGFTRPGRISFTRFILAAFVMHQVVSLARSWWHRWQQRHNRELADVDGQYEEEEEVNPDVAAADARLKQELLPAMMRAALPKPQNRSRAHQQAQAHRARARHLPTASKMMSPGANVKQRQPGMLGKLDKAMRQQVRQVVLAQEQAHQLQLEAAKHALMLQGATAAKQLTNGEAGTSRGSPTQAALAHETPPQRSGVVMQAAAQPIKKR